MDFLKHIIKHITYDFYERRDGLHAQKHLPALLKSQFDSAGDLEELQLKRLAHLLDFCYTKNPFYHDRWKESGVTPQDIKSTGDLRNLPILKKDDIRSAGDKLFSEGYSKSNSIHNRTGGSTGVPIHVYVDPWAASVKRAATRRHNSWAGLTPGARVASVWGDTDKPLPLKERLRNALMDRAIYLDTLKFDTGHILKFVEGIRRHRPEIMLGHAHSIYRFAEFIVENRIHHLGIRKVITTAMVLSDAERSVIERALSAEVFDRYGCEELSIIASECEAHSGLHIFAEGLIVEVEDEGTDSPGKLLITDLLNRAMPMIRYEIGDFAISDAKPCACGRNLPRLRRIVGRTADFLYTPERKRVFGISILDTFIIHIPGIKQLQIVQDQYDFLTIFLVRASDFSETTVDALKHKIEEIFGPRMRFEIKYADAIKQTERGKYRFSICNIQGGS